MNSRVILAGLCLSTAASLAACQAPKTDSATVKALPTGDGLVLKAEGTLEGFDNQTVFTFELKQAGTSFHAQLRSTAGADVTNLSCDKVNDVQALGNVNAPLWTCRDVASADPEAVLTVLVAKVESIGSGVIKAAVRDVDSSGRLQTDYGILPVVASPGIAGPAPVVMQDLVTCKGSTYQFTIKKKPDGRYIAAYPAGTSVPMQCRKTASAKATGPVTIWTCDDPTLPDGERQVLGTVMRSGPIGAGNIGSLIGWFGEGTAVGAPGTDNIEFLTSCKTLPAFAGEE